ncbi:glutathione S-transferase C-terminal-like protein [Hygrophoropsis aurantiaca]|uniref:Glutathione S-transferase C-terminal-like protein n=1 Tax=Hygrophoropsis aurantiaca TaxID=72124 RepID=A0ACB8AL47_9AGAM|nr:glutathione S-transferase C-terminal-like protein [Hygrophoropsis aurantiaca]
MAPFTASSIITTSSSIRVVSDKQLTLYRFRGSPFSHKIELALAEANAPTKLYEVDLFNKPEWFAEKINPTGKIPAITYGGPDVDPQDPSPVSEKLAESGVVLEFIADLYPDSGLCQKTLPFAPGVKESVESLLKGIEAVQALLPESGEYAVEDAYTIADATLIPWILWLKVTYEHELGKFAPEEARKLKAELHGPKFEKFMRYGQKMLERKTTQSTFDEACISFIHQSIVF